MNEFNENLGDILLFSIYILMSIYAAFRLFQILGIKKQNGVITSISSKVEPYKKTKFVYGLQLLEDGDSATSSFELDSPFYLDIGDETNFRLGKKKEIVLIKQFYFVKHLLSFFLVSVSILLVWGFHFATSFAKFNKYFLWLLSGSGFSYLGYYFLQERMILSRNSKDFIYVNGVVVGQRLEYGEELPEKFTSEIIFETLEGKSRTVYIEQDIQRSKGELIEKLRYSEKFPEYVLTAPSFIFLKLGHQ